MTTREAGKPDVTRWDVDCLFCGWHFWSEPRGSGIQGGCEFRDCEALNELRRGEGLAPLKELAPCKPGDNQPPEGNSGLDNM